MELPRDLFQSCLSPTDSSTPVRFQAAITQAAGALHVEACVVDVAEYEKLGHCKRELLGCPAPVAISSWSGPDEDRVVTSIEEGYWRIAWRNETLYLLSATWREGWDKYDRSWIIARTREIAHAFILDVSRTTNDPRDAITSRTR
jgi:hypothetical protein